MNAVASRDGNLLVTITRPKPGCAIVELEFDPATLVGKLETVETSGQRNTFPKIKVKLVE